MPSGNNLFRPECRFQNRSFQEKLKLHPVFLRSDEDTWYATHCCRKNRCFHKLYFRSRNDSSEVWLQAGLARSSTTLNPRKNPVSFCIFRCVIHLALRRIISVICTERITVDRNFLSPQWIRYFSVEFPGKSLKIFFISQIINLDRKNNLTKNRLKLSFY